MVRLYTIRGRVTLPRMSNVTPETEADLMARVRLAIDSGAAICLVGAGFSTLATDGSGNSVPSVSALATELKNLFGIAESEQASLAEVADFAEDQPDGQRKLNSYLVQRLTSTVPSLEQAAFLSLDWRAIFTTNFDDVIEQVGVTRRIPVTPVSQTGSISPDLTPIYYMHGRALDLRERDMKPSIILSEANYLKIERQNRDLYAKFFNEIVCARAIIIVGYSIKDIEVAAGLLNAGGEVRDKTYIINSANDTKFTQARLKKFGRVLSCGINGFLELYRSSPPPDKTIKQLQFLEEAKFSAASDENEAEDFLSLVLTGELDPSRFLRQRLLANEPYCVERSELRTILESPVNRFLVSSDFGNGKSAFLQQIGAVLIEQGYRVFFANTNLLEVFEDIESVLRAGTPVAFLVDDVLRYRDVAIFIGERLHANAKLIATTRGDQDSRFEAIASRFGGAFRSIDVSTLDGAELNQWDALLERWGYWEQRSGQTPAQRLDFLRTDCGSETRSIILALFEKSQVAQTIDRIVEFFLHSTAVHRRAFAGLLISSLCQKHVSWASVISWLDLDEQALRSDVQESEIAFLFQRGRNWNLFTSAQLADFILRNKFVEGDRDLLVETYSTIVLKTADSANDSRSGWDFRENLKELMRFRFLTRLFGNSDGAGLLIGRVYRRLSEAPRIRDNPQFWLQYAMSRIEADDIDGAERYIKTALSKAKSRGIDYSNFQILDQRARLYFMKNARNKTMYSELEIRTAVADLRALADKNDYDVVYTMRSLPLILDFLEEHIDNLSGDIRKRLTDLFEILERKSKEYPKFPRAQKGETKVLKDALAGARLILFNA